MAEILLTATTKRDKQGVKRINQDMKNLAFEFQSKLYVTPKETQEDFDNVWKSVHKLAGK
jgi:hypothetical protein